VWSWIWKPGSLRLRLLITIVSSVAILSVLAMVSDYRRERRRRFARVTTSLAEQASALQAAHGLIADANEFRRYVDEFCATMDTRISPGHHIVVLNSDGSVFASSRRHSGLAVERALLETGRQEGITGVGRHRLAYIRASDPQGNTFILGQYLDQVEAVLLSQLRRRALWLVVIAAVSALLIYLAVALWVVGPLEKLIAAAKRWRHRDFSARASLSGPSDIRVISREFNTMAQELEIHEHTRRRELDEARDIQTNLLPKFPPAASGLVVAAEYRPATEVAGDLYDAFPLPGGKTALAVLDVSGHGVSAAMLTGVVKISLRRCLAEYASLPEAMEHVNADVLACTPDEYFVTAHIGIWDPSACRWTYCAAGHPGGVLIRAGQVRELPSTAPLLGVLPAGRWETHSVTLEVGDRVVLYTDGIVEAYVGGSPFGADGLMAVLSKAAHLDLSEQVKAAIRAVTEPNAGHLTDDATILAFECGAGASGRSG